MFEHPVIGYMTETSSSERSYGETADPTSTSDDRRVRVVPPRVSSWAKWAKTEDDSDDQIRQLTPGAAELIRRAQEKPAPQTWWDEDFDHLSSR